MKKAISKVLSLATMFMISVALMGCEPSGKAEIQPGPDVTDAEGNVYPSVKIGNQIWMAKNLNVNVPGSMCYENKPENCEKYGRLYTWKAAKVACPTGWHLPSKDEFEMLLDTVGASGEDRFKNLRVGSWDNGKDKYGFSALPAGGYDSHRKKFYILGDGTKFWSSTEGNSYSAYYLDDFFGSYGSVLDNDKNDGYSVRCLQDYTADDMTDAGIQQGPKVTDTDGNVYPSVKIDNQIWMAKNLNVNVPGSMCYENKPENCEKYGRLYTWEAAMNACPSGWHLPSYGEFEIFGVTVASRGAQIETKEKRNAEPLKGRVVEWGKHLRITTWGNGVNTFGFSALPAGHYNSNYKEFRYLGSRADFWSSTESNSGSANYLSIDGDDAGVHHGGKLNGFSVRCLQN